MNIYFIFPCQLSECPPRSEKWPPWDSFERTFFPSTGTCTPITLAATSPQSSLVFFLFPLCLQYGTCINNSWPVIRASSIGDLLMEGRCSRSVPGGMLRVVVSAPICQNAIRQTMEALISTSRPIIFKWLLAEECNQSITDKILLKASLPLSLLLSLSPFLLISLFLSASQCLSSFLFLVKLGHSCYDKTLIMTAVTGGAIINGQNENNWGQHPFSYHLRNQYSPSNHMLMVRDFTWLTWAGIVDL